MAIINQTKLSKYLSLNLNVLFRGRHGVGKTAIIQKVFDDAGLRWKYFSASTMDPWVDFVGVPKVFEVDGKSILKNVRQEFIENDEVEAIFLDEFNRAEDKVINAVMELIQFKSINGHRLKNLKVIWAAINPEDDEDTYSVNHLDPAHLDRFQVKLDVPFEVDEEFFLGKYPKTGKIFIDWWRGIDTELRYEVSPRRLDYAAEAHENDCRLEDFLPTKSGVKKLRGMLKSIPFLEKLQEITSTQEAEKLLKNINNVTLLIELTKAKESKAIAFFDKYAKLLPKELLAPFVDAVLSAKMGSNHYDNIDDLVEKLPVDDKDRGCLETAVAINNADILSSGDLSLVNIIAGAKGTSTKKLANRIYDIVIRYDAVTLHRQFWGVQGREENTPTNFYKVTKALSTFPDTFSPLQHSRIMEKLFKNKIIDAPQFP